MKFVGVLLAAWAVWGAWAKPVPRAKIAVVKAVTACVAADRAYAATLAEKTRRWLAEGGVKVDLVEDRALASALAGRRLVYLVVCQKPSQTHLETLARFRAQGGRIAALQSYSPELAAAMGVPAPKTPRTGPIQVARVPGGWWAANLFGATGSEEAKARTLLEMAAAAVPGSWSAPAWEARRAARLAAERDYGRLQCPRPGEIHAVQSCPTDATHDG